MRSLLPVFVLLLAVRAIDNEATASVQEATTTTSLRTAQHETTTATASPTEVPLASSSAASPNVPPPAVILPNATTDEKDAYGKLQRSLLDQLDTSNSPCASFYEYTCRNGTTSMFAEAEERKNQQLKKRLDEPPPSGSTAKAFHYFRSCVQQFDKPVEQQAADWRRVLEELLQEVPDWSFPFVPELPAGRPTAHSFGAFLGVLYRDFGLRFPFDVELRRKEDGRLSVLLDAPFRTRTMGDSQLGELEHALLVTRRLGGNLTDEQKKELEDGFEHISGVFQQTGDSALQTNSYPIFLELFPSLDFRSFFSALFAHSPELLALVEGEAAERLEIQWVPAALRQLHNLTTEALRDERKAAVLVELLNTLVFKRLAALHEENSIGKCMQEIVGFDLHFVRFFVDAFDEGDDRKRRDREAKLNRMVGGIRDNLRAMLESVEWLNEESQRRVLEKVNAYTYHLSYDQQAFDDALLLRIADRLNVRPNDPFFSVYRAVARLEVALLLDRANGTLNCTAGPLCFFGLSTWVNAFYMPDDHSINIPLGIQILPLFDEAYPIGAQFGILGVVLGHEMGHAFDTDCYLRDARNQPNPVLVGSSKADFLAEIQCVTREYDAIFRHFNQTEFNATITLGENFADNIGLPVAYRAFKQHEMLDGPDDRMEDPLLRQFTNDQLFFLAFSRLWCEPLPQLTPGQGTGATHSPGFARVVGSIQNFPAFRAAFNCPLGSEYAPATPCHVWATAPKTVKP